MIRLILLAALAALVPRSTEAQLYSWRDANGTLVISDRRQAAATEVFDVAGSAPTVKATRPAPVGMTGRFDTLIQEHAARQNLQPELVRAVIQVESAFNPRATSPKGAMGLMQLMPQTARELGVRDPYDPADNIAGGTRYLRQLMDLYDDDLTLALAAYNAGPGAVAKYGDQVPPYRETQDYVEKVASAAGPGASAAPAPPAGRVMYKTVQIIDGREVPRFSDRPPASGPYEVIQLRSR